jgi:polygalacturonase
MQSPTTRRGFARALGFGAAAALLRVDRAWGRAAVILSRIRPPVFPARDFDVTKYGAAGDGVKDCTQAFRLAIAACNAAGGGRVIVPDGRFLSGAIHFKSHVNLHVTRGATIQFTRQPAAYLPLVVTRWEGVECMNYSPFLYCYGQRDIAITGEGTLDGQADFRHWWPWKGRTDYGWNRSEPNQAQARAALFKMGEAGVPVEERIFGEGHWLRPQFIQPYRTNNVLIQGVTIVNSPMWEIHPVLCRNVTVRGVKIASHGPNNDGCDPESSGDVLIEDCLFDTGDDCIALKSGRNRDGRRLAVPCENLIVRRCTMKDGHGGVTIGSEISGGARNIFAEDCKMDSPNLECALRLKTNSVRGGVIENIHMRNVEVGQVSKAIVSIDFHYEEGDAGPFKPVVRNIDVRHVTSKKSKYGLYLRGFKDALIQDVRIEKCTFENVARPDVIEHVKGLSLVDVTVNGAPRR